MPCCCRNIYKLCDVVICDDQDLVLPIPIAADGEYTLELQFLGAVVRKTANLSTGDNATFNKEDLNEQFTYVGNLLDPTGQLVSFTIDEKVYDCFEFTTKRLIAA